MPSSNPRYLNHKARQAVLRYVRMRVEEGEPCAICGKPIDLELPQWIVKNGKKSHAPWALECDEIIPVSMGGSPIDRANVQPAHKACNQRKGGRKNTHQKIASHKGNTSREW